MKNKYDKTISELEEAINTKELGEVMENKFYQYIDMLRDNIFGEEEKYKVSIVADGDLKAVRDFPNKVSNMDDNRGRIR